MARVIPAAVTGHPAPWPVVDLDVAAVKEAGHTPIPFRQFILKIHSRCNLSCSYCYVYEMADQAWREMPRRMSLAVATKTVQRIAEHAARHGLESVDVILHGGEPLLAGTEWLAGLVVSLHRQVPAHVKVSVQTNGTLLSRPVLESLKSSGISIGVSLDGDAEATGRHRRYANGRNSFDAIADGLRLLQLPEFRDFYSGLLCTIDTRNNPVDTYEALLTFSPPVIDLLLPHANWTAPPPGGGYADWLISVFDRWYSAPRQETQIRLFRELIQLVLGQPGEVEGLGLLPSTLIVVDTDGSIKELDSLSSAYSGAADTGLHVFSGSFDDALDHPTTVARQIGRAAMSAQCLDCPVLKICGGGLYPHRYRHGTGFRNPSVYCADLLRLITYVRDRVVADLHRIGALHLRLDLCGEPYPLRRGKSFGMLRGERFRVLSQRVGKPPLRAGHVSRGRLIHRQVGRRHKRIRMHLAERLMAEALLNRPVPDLDRLAESPGRGEICGEINVGRQSERVLVAVDPQQSISGLFVVCDSILGVSRRPEYGGEVQLCGVEEQIVRRAGLPTAAVSLIGQFLGADKIAHGAAVVDQVGGRSQREHVLVT